MATPRRQGKHRPTDDMRRTRAMLLSAPHARLVEVERALASPGPGQVRVRMEACAVCRTDLHLVDGELSQARYPIVPGHEIVGVIEALGAAVEERRVGERVGVPWLAWTCGQCGYCTSGRENLCDRAEFTGCTRDGGYATDVIAEADYCVPLPGIDVAPARIAPLLCAGVIGWRAYRAAGTCRSIGFYGFGASAHLLAQVLAARGIEVFAFTRPGDDAAQSFARGMGACWAGASDEPAPKLLDGAIVFAPEGSLIPSALAGIRKGGRVVCAGIHMSDLPGFPYRLLWGERQLVSVANLTRDDARAFFEVATSVRAEVSLYALTDANAALDALRRGEVRGAAVLLPA